MSKPVFYPDSQSPFDKKLFKNPTAHYRGAPFWAWNNQLKKDQLEFEIDSMKEMGFGGFHIHSRVGLDTDYLGEEFLRLTKDVHDYALKEHGLFTYLYDEDKFPSGSCGGTITKDNPEFRAQHLLFTRVPYGQKVLDLNGSPFCASRTENGSLIATYKIILDEDGYLVNYERISDPDSWSGDDGCSIWYAYHEYSLPSGWYNDSTYVDTLNKKAIENFLETTHEKYHSILAEYFNKSVKSIFTDEPQFTHKSTFENAELSDEAFYPWTGDLTGTYEAKYGTKLLDTLPELFWELPKGKTSKARWCFHNHISERFTEAFVETIHTWCRANGIQFTGHMLDEEDLLTQTTSLGEAMRAYKHFDIPGTDILQDKHEYHTIKQAQSVVRQYNKEGLMCENYGVTNWNFTFQGHKSQGDWLACLGVTFRVPHLYWVTMKGESKRDFPASIGYQSPWYKEYSLIEDHYARINTVLTKGKSVVRIAVIHPIESYWLDFGPWGQTALAREERQTNFDNLIKWLIYGLLDFDYIAESLFEEQTNLGHIVNGQLPVGQMKYDVILVPGLKTMRRSTYDRLFKFKENGGQLIFLGDIPILLDSEESKLPSQLASKSIRIPFSKKHIQEILSPFREVDITFVDSVDHDCLLYSRLQETILYNLKEDSEGTRYLFLVNTSTNQSRFDSKITLVGEWKLTILDSLTGEVFPYENTTINNGKTTFYWNFEAISSLLVKLEKVSQNIKKFDAITSPKFITVLSKPLDSPQKVVLDEPNVLILDNVKKWKTQFDNEWFEGDEILRVGELIRDKLSLEPKGFMMVQPYIYKRKSQIKNYEVSLKFEFESNVSVDNVELATELIHGLKLWLDNEPIEVVKTGWWVDLEINKIKFPMIKPGKHTITYTIPFNQLEDLESIYILGDFGVTLNGPKAIITSDGIRSLEFGDWTKQGLPFYGGSVNYYFDLKPLKLGFDTYLRIPEFQAPLIVAYVDGKKLDPIAFSPFRIKLIEGGELVLKVYGDRYNTFGHLHFFKPAYPWCAPNAWRTTGDSWTSIYQIQEKGLTTVPQLEISH